jgi:hypothetical protein
VQDLVGQAVKHLVDQALKLPAAQAYVHAHGSGGHRPGPRDSQRPRIRAVLSPTRS